MSAGPGDGALVVARDHTASDKPLEGAGVFSSWYDVYEGVERGDDGWGVAATVTAAGLDTLGAAMNPLGALAQSAVGFLIEHVSFLHEPLDALAGDPIQIEDQARTWRNIAARLREVAETTPGAVPEGWTGDAADAYGRAVTDLANRLTAGADGIDGAVEAILVTGADVGTIRALIRDVVAEWVGNVVGAALLAAASSWFTLGGSVGAFLAWAVGTAVRTGAESYELVAVALDRLGMQARRLTVLTGELGGLTEPLARRADGLASTVVGQAEGWGRTVLDAPPMPGRLGNWLEQDAFGGRPAPLALADGNDHVRLTRLGATGAAHTQFVDPPLSLAAEAGKQQEAAERVTEDR